jgi:hypothetical protein
MEDVIEYEYLTGARGGEVLNDVAVASENSIETFPFLSAYSMNPNSSLTPGPGVE